MRTKTTGVRFEFRVSVVSCKHQSELMLEVFCRFMVQLREVGLGSINKCPNSRVSRSKNHSEYGFGDLKPYNLGTRTRWVTQYPAQHGLCRSLGTRAFIRLPGFPYSEGCLTMKHYRSPINYQYYSVGFFII